MCSTAAVGILQKPGAGPVLLTKINYEEVFMTSNVPQIIVTSTRRITSCKFYVLCFGMVSII